MREPRASTSIHYTAARLDERLVSMCAELQVAWSNSDKADLEGWAIQAAKDYAHVLKRRIFNVGKLFAVVGAATSNELQGVISSYRDDRLIDHLTGRRERITETAKNLVSTSRKGGERLYASFNDDPGKVGAELVVIILVSLLVSGGPDGDGGVPDLDLQLGIGFHRSIFSHSILAGAALEAGLLSLANLAGLVQKRLPTGHDPLWDVFAHHSTALLNAANKGASIGMAYHLLIDGLVQPAPYRGLDIELPMEVHQGIFVANSLAEAADVTRKSGPDPWTDHAYGTAPPKISQHAKNAHQHLRQQRLQMSRTLRASLTFREVEVLSRYGMWLGGLAAGELTPYTLEQANFVEVVKGRRAPFTEYELAWMKYWKLSGRPIAD